jgi:hyperosmotically inducible protein
MKAYITGSFAAAMLLACGPGTREVMRSLPATPAGSADRVVNVVQTHDIGEEHLTREIRHELVMLPSYGVFDNLTYKVNGGIVTLTGEVTHASLKTEAENVVKHIEGVQQVVNEIRMLPNSPEDDKLRLALFHAIYADDTLSRYAVQAVPPIHIVVDKGNANLEGVVATEADKNMAELRAKEVPGVVSVTNDLRVGA